MKLNKRARTLMKLLSATEKKKVVSAARTLFDAGLISNSRAALVARNYK